MSLSLKNVKQSKFMNAKSIDPGKALTLQINDIDMLDISKDGDGSQTKAGISWVEEGHKPMLLNATNTKLLEMICGGTEPDNYLGKKVEIWHDPTVTNPGGEMVGGLRLRAPQQTDIPM